MTFRTMLEADFIQDKRNGSGYELFLPRNPRDLFDIPDDDPSPVMFEEVEDIIDALRGDHHNTLVVGEPGAGKSHLRDDLTMAKAALHSVAYLSVTLHINGGKAVGPEVAAKQVERLIASGDTTKLVVFDNVDFLGYRGKSRTRSLASSYANEMADVIKETLAAPGLAVIGTAHDDEWRNGRWQWQDRAIDEPARAVLDAFDSQFSFDGKLTPYGRSEIAHQRGLTEQMVAGLTRAGLTSFFYFQHLDPKTYNNSPEDAINDIKEGRLARKYR